MRTGSLAIAAMVIAATLSCAPHGAVPATGTPVPQSASGGAGVAATVPASQAPPTAVPPGAVPAANAPRPGGPPPGGPPGGGRPQLTPEQRAARRDSAAAMRSQVLAELSTKIAGYENRRAEDEFTNIQLLKDTTASQLLKVMDYYGKSLGVGCTYCHVGGGKWDEDSKDEKRTTRVMINLVNLINTQGLSKLEPNRNGQTPRISCITCHRGNTRPGMALVP